MSGFNRVVYCARADKRNLNAMLNAASVLSRRCCRGKNMVYMAETSEALNATGTTRTEQNKVLLESISQ